MPAKLQHYRTVTPDKRPDPAAMADGQMAQNQAPSTPGAFIKLADASLSKIGPTHVGPTAPNSAPAGSAGNSLGESWLDTSVAPPLLRVWDGAQWVAAVTSAGGSKWTDMAGGYIVPAAGGSVGVDSSSKFILGFDAFGGAEIYYDGVDGHFKLSPRQTFHTILTSGYLGFNCVPHAAIDVNLDPYSYLTESGARFSANDGMYGAEHGGGAEEGLSGYGYIDVLNGSGAVRELIINPNRGQFNVRLLSGTGTEMVVADDAGNLTRQPIGSGPQGPAGADGAPGLDGAAGPQGPAGPTAVSADAGNTSTLGTDGLIYTPGVNTGLFVPQDSPTGAAFMPASGDAGRPAGPGGMTRWNPDRGYMEVFTDTAAGWNQLAYVDAPPVLPDDFTFTSGLYSGTIVCNNCTVPADVTVTVDGTLYIKAEGNVQIGGIINGVGLGPYGGSGYQTFIGSYANGGSPNILGPSGTGPCPGAATSGGKRSNVMQSMLGSGGAAGFAALNGAVDGAQIATICHGGNAGATFLVKAAGSIVFWGNINCTGLTPVMDRNQTAIASGGGGGSGGVVILDAVKDCTNAGIIYCIGANGEGAHNDGGGGGGGAGGIVIVQSRVGTSTLGNCVVTGGAPGLSGVSGPGGGGGGGCGGFGGDTQNYGGNGIAATTGSPL